MADTLLPIDSAGQVAGEDGPTPAVVVVPEGRVNSLSVNNIASGLNNPTRTLQQTQSTPGLNPNNTSGFGINPNNVNGFGINPNAATNAGVGARSDDNTGPTTNSTQQSINTTFNQTIAPQPNVLDQYISYTYGLSWYVLTPDQITAFVQGSRNTGTWQLFAQSGGASQTGRNQFFNLDYYLDNLTIDTYVMGKGTGMAHSATELEFTVTEPNGITLIDNIYGAVSNLYKEQNITDRPSYLQATYCMVIKFYGYDANGNLVYPAKGGVAGQPNTTDQSAVIVKYFPFLIENLTFRIEKKVIEYRIKGKPLPVATAYSQDRGSIPFQFELMGQTVADVLVGKPVGTTYSPSDGRQDTPLPAEATTNITPAPSNNNLQEATQASIAAGDARNTVIDPGGAQGVG